MREQTKAPAHSFQPLPIRGLWMLVGLLIMGGVFLSISLLYLMDSLPRPQSGEGVQRWAATVGLAVGVLFVVAVVAALLGHVWNLGQAVARLVKQAEEVDRDKPCI